MAYEMVMPYHLHMPSYFLETFTEYPKKQASQKKTDACSFYRERIFYFNRANASLMRRIASIIFSSEVA